VNATLARLTRLTPDPLVVGDGPLLDAFLAGDQSAFAVLVRRHAGLVFATCRRVLRHQQDAEDAFQATFLVLARRAADVWPREAVGSWLFGVARRVALKARTVRGRRRRREQPFEEGAGAERSAPEVDLAEVVQRVVCKLPEVYRAAVIACDLEGLSRKAAAERLGWSEGTLSGRLARARQLLANRLRRLGLSLPVGLAGVLATSETVSAGVIRTTIDLGTGTAAVGASGPVAALTEGVVRSMSLFQFKTMAAAVFVACAVGFGALAAAGTGTRAGAEAGAQDRPTQLHGSGVPTVPAGAKPVDPPAKPSKTTKPVTDRDRLQGTWRVVSLTEGGTTAPTNPKDPWVIEVSGNTLSMPYLEGGSSSSGSSTSGGANTSSATTTTSGSGWKQRTYTFAVDETKVPRTIDLIANSKPLARGIYEFTLPAAQCASCHTNPFDTTGAKLPEVLGVCAPVLKDRTKVHDLGVRLALSIDGNRPDKFGGDGVIVFELKRPDTQDKERLRLEAEQALLVEAQKRVADELKAALAAEEKKRLEIQLEMLRLQMDQLIVRETQRKALVELRKAEADLNAARAQALLAQANAERAALQLKEAKAKVAAAEKALADLSKAQPGGGGAAGAVFSVHVRTLTAAEKVIRVKATGKETVLEGLVHAADDVPIKSEGVNVWVVRDKTVLPVDLPAILKGDAKTNHLLKAGDQLFVQAKPAK
jgi:RNA polymerase sigma factor (sigma-70 family)